MYGWRRCKRSHPVRLSLPLRHRCKANPCAPLTRTCCHSRATEIATAPSSASAGLNICLRFSCALRTTAADPLLPDVLITGKRCHWLIEVFLHTGGNNVGILDSHDRTLAQEWQRWMASITKQRDAGLRPAIDRAADHQRPFIRRVEAFNEGMNVRMPTAEIVGQLAFRPFDRPRFGLRRRGRRVAAG